MPVQIIQADRLPKVGYPIQQMQAKRFIQTRTETDLTALNAAFTQAKMLYTKFQQQILRVFM
ncbi:hypothetical protein B7993_02915 [Fibrobacter sp. UWH3]|nr:hypothetical protein B7993_02915 [Fibrobacter sp. UWH3]OWV11903.1 hypothetical protein B7992_09940 [Fibrobacter sp. UWH1]